MSKIIKWSDVEVLQPNKEHLRQNILGQIILLNKYLTDSVNNSQKNSIKNAIDTLYYIFRIIEERDFDISNSANTRVMNYINQILDNILMNQN